MPLNQFVLYLPWPQPTRSWDPWRWGRPWGSCLGWPLRLRWAECPQAYGHRNTKYRVLNNSCLIHTFIFLQSDRRCPRIESTQCLSYMRQFITIVSWPIVIASRSTCSYPMFTQFYQTTRHTPFYNPSNLSNLIRYLIIKTSIIHLFIYLFINLPDDKLHVREHLVDALDHPAAKHQPSRYLT